MQLSRAGMVRWIILTYLICEYYDTKNSGRITSQNHASVAVPASYLNYVRD